MLVQAIRSLVFYALFLGQTVVLAIIAGLIALFSRGRNPAVWLIARYWGAANLFLLRWVVGISSKVEGAEHIPEGGCIIASKHQSDWDIFAILPHTEGKPAFIAKRQLLDIPFFGRAARSFDTIRVDRKRGGEAIPLMIADARAAVGRGCKIVIFPEGTRKAPLAEADYRYGVVRLYQALGVPVVPVALNSGLTWGRNSLVLWPGTATARFLPPIAPGLEADAFKHQLVETIEAETEKLMLEAFRHGLPRPLPQALRDKFARLEARAQTTTA